MKFQPPPQEFASHDTLVQAASTITAALIARADPGEDITPHWIASAYAQAYAALLIAPPQVEGEYKLAIRTPGQQTP